MHLSDAWMTFALLPVAMYVVLDGYDVGIGVLTLFERDDGRRRDLYDLAADAWDGNESWLVLLGLTLWAGLPIAAGITVPGLYIALFPMMWALIARGVAIEVIARHGGWHPVWGKVLGIGSLVAGFCQGAAFGGLVAGASVGRDAFAGGPWSFLNHGYALLTGVTAVALYLVAGSAWVYLKCDGELKRRAARVGWPAAAALAAGTAASWALLSDVGPTTLHPDATARLPIWIAGAAVVASGLALAFRSFRPERSACSPVRAALAVYGGGLLVAGGLLYPMTASPHSTVLFLLIVAGLLVPLIVAYQAYGFWAFRGKLIVRPEQRTT